MVTGLVVSLQRYQDTPGVEHIPVVQIDLSVPLKVPGKCLCGVRVLQTSFRPAPALALSSQHPPLPSGPQAQPHTALGPLSTPQWSGQGPRVGAGCGSQAVG